MEKVKIVDHGPAFGNTHWYLFYCPKCKSSVQRLTESENSTCACGQLIQWPTPQTKHLWGDIS